MIQIKAMETYFVFTSAIYILVFVLGLFSIKICLDMVSLLKTANKSCLTLEKSIEDKKQKHQIFKHQILLVDQLNSSLINRLFQISKDLILIQKFIFGKYVK
jgi:hypothetical protein